MNQNNVSKTLFLLDSNIDKKKLNSYDLESSTIIVFDYSIHKFLNEKKIQHKIADDYLDDNERTELFKLTSNYLQKYEKISDSGISFHEIDLLTIVDRNELLEFLMQILPKIQIIKKILEQDTYKKIFATSEIYEIFVNTKFSSHFERLTYVDQNPLTFENIQIPFKFGNQEIKFSINRKKYKILKQNVEKISGALFNLKNNMEEKNKIILLEFDPQIYFELLKQIDASGYQPVLINFRKSPTYSMGAIKNLKQSNSLIITPENFLENDDFEEISHAKISISKILKEILKNTEHFPNLISKETNFDLLLKNKIINIILQRLDEYLLQILIAEKIKKMNNVKCIIGLNFSGETEKIFSRLNEKIPILLLQHAFANYLQSISHFDILDDYHLIQDKIAVWGDIVKNYLINVRKIPENKIIVSGSPKYDSYSTSSMSNNKKIILVTLRPIISHMEGFRIKLFEKYEKTIQNLIQIFENMNDVEVLFKLHPQQNITNKIIMDMIKPNKKFKILQFDPIKELLSNCSYHINIAPENFDASSVILEAMLLKKPTLNIQLQKNDYDFEFNTMNAIKSVYYDSDIKTELQCFLDDSKKTDLINNSQNFLSKYMKNMGSASKKLIDSIDSF